jgi:PAS domain S-box-containing protein
MLHDPGDALEGSLMTRKLSSQDPRPMTKKSALNGARNAPSLKESEKRLSRIVHGLSIAAFVIDENHVITHCNKAFENLTGLTAEALVGTRNQWKTFYPSQRPILADFIVDGASEEEIAVSYAGKYRKSSLIEGAYEVENFFPTLQGGGKWLFFTAAPLLDDKGNVVGAIETLQDISDRKKAEEALRLSERRQRALLNFEPYPIVVFSLDGRVSYLNPAFTETFGWTLEELENKRIPFVPPGFERETREGIKRLYAERVIMHFGTRRLTKDGRILDVVIRAAVFFESKDEPAGIIVILRDVTQEKRIARNNEAMLRISMALPEHPDLGDLLYYVNSEVKALLGTEGAMAVLHDEIRGDLFILGAAYDDRDTQQRIEEVRFPLDQLIAGRVIRTGEPIIVSDTSSDRELHGQRDKRLGYRTRNLAQVPLKSSDRIIGAICAINKKTGSFDETDLELLNMVAGTVALSIENARFSEDLKKALRNNEALLRISLALPKHPRLEELIDYVNDEVKRLVDSEGSVVLLLDEKKQEFLVLGAAYDATETENRIREIRFPMDQLMAGKVVRTGEPLIVSDMSVDRRIHEERDKRLGYKTKNLALVPLRTREHITGVLCAINRKEGEFDRTDLESLNTIAGTVALSIENARVSEELRKAYEEVTSLNRAKDKAINHLSHELKTPVAIVSSSLNLLAKRMTGLPDETWKPTLERIKRNLDRILEIQYEVDDIMEDKQQKIDGLLTLLLDQCAEELSSVVAEESGQEPLFRRIKEHLDRVFGPKEAEPRVLHLDQEVTSRLDSLKPLFPHREVTLLAQLESVPPIFVPPEVLHKVIDGLIRNAVENTPDEGKIEVAVRKRGHGALLIVRDYGVGIREEAQKRIFEGFFTTRDTMAYSSKRPFDFNAGGKGADLLRMKIFSERYHFQIHMASTRCKHLPRETDVCPGRISRCPQCSKTENCHESGGTLFTVYFPPAA